MYRKIIIAGATAAAVLGGGGAALAVSGSSDSPAPSTSSSTSPNGTHAGKHPGSKGRKGGKAAKGRRLLRHLDHADIVVHTKKQGTVTRELIRGTVTSVSASSISVTSADHTVRTFVVSKDTVVRSRTKGSKPQTATISNVAKGDHVFVGGVARAGAKPVARHIADVHAK